jgi:two-component system chemotaxis sensor kinase CheA
MDVLFEAADALEMAIEMSVAGRGEQLETATLVGRLQAFASTSSASITPATRAALPEESARQRAPGAGRLITVRLAADTPMKGVRAFLIVQRMGRLGTVLSTSPPVDGFQADGFDGAFAVRLASQASPEEIELEVRSAGHVDRLTIDGASGNGHPPADEPASAATGWASEAIQQRQHRHVRIDLQRLDALMNLIGELVITRGRLQQLSSGLGSEALEETVAQASRLIADLQDGIMSSRMVPVWQVFDRFPRVVRDAARALGKQIDFLVEGKDIELDRSLLDEIGDPVIHLLRNAIDHGIELPEARLAAGKPTQGRLVLEAARDRSAVVIRVTDDGKGIDRDAVLQRAREQGLVDPAKATLTDEEMMRLIGRPGFSTASRVTDMSGRGVGIDAVATRVRTLGGSLDIRTVRGEGTSVTVRLPVTLAIVRALLARVGGETYAVPMTHVNETVQLESDAVRTVKGREVLVLRDDVLPLVHLRDVVRLPRRDATGSQVVVLEVADKRAGMVVDELTGQQEIVIKPYDAVRDGAALFSGATILGDGVPALILDVSSLL